MVLVSAVLTGAAELEPWVDVDWPSSKGRQIRAAAPSRRIAAPAAMGISHRRREARPVVGRAVHRPAVSTAWRLLACEGWVPG